MYDDMVGILSFPLDRILAPLRSYKLFLFFSFLPGTVRISQYVIVFVIERGERNLTH